MNNLGRTLLIVLFAITMGSAVDPWNVIGGNIKISPQKLVGLRESQPNFAAVWEYTKDIIARNCGIGLGKLIQASYQVIEGLKYEFVVETQYGQLRVVASIRYWTSDIQFQDLSFINFNGIDQPSSKMRLTPTNSPSLPEKVKTTPIPLFTISLAPESQNLYNSITDQCEKRKKIRSKLVSSFTASIISFTENSNKTTIFENKTKSNTTSFFGNQTLNDTMQNATYPQSASPVENGTLVVHQTNQRKLNNSQVASIKIPTTILPSTVNNSPTQNIAAAALKLSPSPTDTSKVANPSSTPNTAPAPNKTDTPTNLRTNAP